MINQNRIMCGPTVKFLLGQDKTPMIIHKVLVEDLSINLRNLVSGHMEEAQSGAVDWNHMEESTFILFAEFAYTGDYALGSESLFEVSSGSEPTKMESEETHANYFREEFSVVQDAEDGLVIAECEPVDAYEDRWSSASSQKRCRRCKRLPETKPVQTAPAKQTFSSLKFPFPSNLIQHYKVRPNASPTEDYTPILLGHARMYVLADAFDIPTLADLALHKLYETLRSFTLYEDRYDDILELVRYIYDDNTKGRHDRLRDLVLWYLASEAKPLIKSEKCLELVQELGEFGRDLLSVVLE